MTTEVLYGHLKCHSLPGQSLQGQVCEWSQVKTQFLLTTAAPVQLVYQRLSESRVLWSCFSLSTCSCLLGVSGLFREWCKGVVSVLALVVAVFPPEAQYFTAPVLRRKLTAALFTWHGWGCNKGNEEAHTNSNGLCLSPTMLRAWLH